MKNESRQPPSDLDAYCDGLLSSTEQREFAGRIAEDAELRAEVELQEAIDRCLQSRFSPPAVRPLEPPAANSKPVGQSLPSPIRPTLSRARSSGRAAHRAPASRRASLDHVGRRWQIAALVAVASLVWLVVAWNLSPRKSDQVVFVPRSPAEVFRETVQRGFEPYYVCDDDARFRETFYRRHGQALQLVDLPQDRAMVGISYCPSISRNTTAMLARVRNQPVMVFVDQRSSDRSIEAPPAESGLRMFRREVGGLVMYEITPLDESLMMPFLVPVAPPPDPGR